MTWSVDFSCNKNACCSGIHGFRMSLVVESCEDEAISVDIIANKEMMSESVCGLVGMQAASLVLEAAKQTCDAACSSSKE